MPPTAATITIPEMLTLLDGPHVGLAEAVAHDHYALWLGSGISLNRLPGLRAVTKKVIGFLQSRVELGNPACRFRDALGRVLAVAGPTKDELARCDLDADPATWPDLDVIAGRLVNQYAQMLNVEVDGEPQDYLLWEAVDVPNTYADPGKEPDVEHLCVATLIVEGVASEVVSANWDGLVEKALAELVGAALVMRTHADSMDLRQTPLRANLYKFHGCAVKAKADPARYREALIGRQPQVTAFPHPAAPMRNCLVGLATTRHTLMLGLSAQDADIQDLFVAGAKDMAWGWPCDPPAYAFSEQALGLNQEALLQNVYGAAYKPYTRAAIKEQALVRAYASRLLPALLLHVLTTKARFLADLAEARLPGPEGARIAAGLARLRDEIASSNAWDDGSTKSFLRRVGYVMSLLHMGRGRRPSEGIYKPITSTPVQQFMDDADVRASGLPEASVGAGLLGMGLEAGDWSITSDDPVLPKAAAAVLKSGTGSARIYFSATAESAIQLRALGIVEDKDDAIIVHSSALPPTSVRSPSGSFGRRGKTWVREVSIGALLASNRDADMLMVRFREETAL
ncbi:hypothetical protein D3272_23560 [Lichenibacterium ramalinae]|uniref:Uncharacterized protein n=1 Tax=Lichenibacterium ramalinae TaxID=2316527 RepID=A0A4Q2R814_9HYPH|nr:hypothetical protein D3272_23560 [Lichenibacterium ramalinae]